MTSYDKKIIRNNVPYRFRTTLYAEGWESGKQYINLPEPYYFTEKSQAVISKIINKSDVINKWARSAGSAKLRTWLNVNDGIVWVEPISRYNLIPTIDIDVEIEIYEVK